MLKFNLFRIIGIFSLIILIYTTAIIASNFIINEILNFNMQFLYFDSLTTIYFANMISIILIIMLYTFWYYSLIQFKQNINQNQNFIPKKAYEIQKLSVIIPAYNEEKNIHKVLENDNPNIWKKIVIDDFSNDNTINIIKQYPVELIKHPKNYGVGAAIKSGYKYGSSIGSKYMVVMAGDNQHSINDLDNLIFTMLNNDLDYIIGSRLLSESISEMPKFRIFGNFLLSFLTSIASNKMNFDSQCGYTIIKSDAINSLNFSIIADRWGIPNDIFFECVRNQKKIGYYPITTIYGSRDSYINIIDFISKLIRILIKGTLNTSINQKTPFLSYDRILLPLMLSILLIFFYPLFSLILILISLVLISYHKII